MITLTNEAKETIRLALKYKLIRLNIKSEDYIKTCAMFNIFNAENQTIDLKVKKLG